ncbi:MAG: DUF441 domain-containing protein [Firmicutes bacterium]|nr:DUF441 domain-containing protein [Bacillota bacterium]
MLKANLVLFALFVLGMLAGNSLIAASAGALLIIKLLKMSFLLEVAERHSLEWGLLFLLIAVMVPLARGKVGGKELLQTFVTPVGLLSLLGGTIATYLCGQGLGLLNARPEVMAGLVVGTVLGVTFFKGIPVGPLAAAGLTALLLKVFELVKK